MPEYPENQTKWLDSAACADLDPNAFFVDAGRVLSSETEAVCLSCPVRKQCVKHAYDLNLSAGYFGALSPSTRRALSLEDALELVDEQDRKKAA